MTPEGWRLVGELFARALGEPVESRVRLAGGVRRA